jgi:hypothetical protein
MKKSVVFYLSHEKFYIIGNKQNYGFYIPLKLFTDLELKLLYNIIYKDKLVIDITGFDHVHMKLIHPIKLELNKETRLNLLKINMRCLKYHFYLINKKKSNILNFINLEINKLIESEMKKNYV